MIDNQLSVSEMSMFSEIFLILKKYESKTRDFGIHLVHSHFELLDSEVMHETHNVNLRTLTIVPVSKQDLPKKSLATAWQFSKVGKIQVSVGCCEDDE